MGTGNGAIAHPWLVRINWITTLEVQSSGKCQRRFAHIEERAIEQMTRDVGLRQIGIEMFSASRSAVRVVRVYERQIVIARDLSVNQAVRISVDSQWS